MPTPNDPINQGVQDPARTAVPLGQQQSTGGQAPISEPTTTPQDPSVPAEPVEVQPDTGTVTRLQQELARQNRVLMSLGIDPASDVAEKFQRGIISRDQLLEEAGIRVPQQSFEPAPQPTT